MQGYVNTVLYRDIVERINVTNLNVLKTLIRHMLRNPATLFTVNKFYHHVRSQGIKVAKTTLHEHLDRLRDAFMLPTVHIKADISGSGTREREVRALFEAGRDNKGAELLLLNMNEESSTTREGLAISILPAWKWLLDYEA